jgi:hydrogenase nickel incorporation protein HypA/HybF
MHELSIIDAVIEEVRGEVERSGHSGRVTRLELVVGRLSGVSVDSLRFGFQLLTPGTLLESAELVIRQPPARYRCPSCGANQPITELVAHCPHCGGNEGVIEGGQELLLQSIELEEAGRTRDSG